jgi:ABC-2 type transport system ATP-binding protein
MSVLYTTHYMEEAERLCRRVGIVDHGRMLACGTRRELVDLVDQHDQVTIRLASNAAQVAHALRGQDGVLDVSATDDRTLVCVVAAASSHLSSLVNALTDAEAVVTDLRVEEPSLDSVFLHITGTALRD